MPGIARKDGVDRIDSSHGTGYKCRSPKEHGTAKGSSDVRVNGTGVVRYGDKMQKHSYPNRCSQHEPTLSTSSSNVFVNGMGVGRDTDNHTVTTGGGTHTLKTGSTNVFANGS